MAYTTIDLPTDYFNTVLYTGNGSTNAITGVGFQPDWVWFKKRSSSGAHYLVDVVRGTTKGLSSNNTDADVTTTDDVQSFDSDGFTLGASGNNYTNQSSATYTSWNWLAGGSASSNTDGSITSSISVNTTAGFSIVSYTGTGANASVGHGLGTAPDCIIVKRREDAGRGWWVYHKDLGATKGIYLHDTATSFTNDWLQDTAPTSTVFTLDNNGDTNGSSKTHIAYCFAEKKGYSKFGSYTGNGGNQFIYTGFKPAFVIEKRSSNTSEWDMYDNKRNTFNSVTKVLKPNASDAEATYSGLNFLSNGFEAKGSLNDSGQTLIYMAFAEAPFVTSGGIPTTAR